MLQSVGVIALLFPLGLYTYLIITDRTSISVALPLAMTSIITQIANMLIRLIQRRRDKNANLKTSIADFRYVIVFNDGEFNGLYFEINTYGHLLECEISTCDLSTKSQMYRDKLGTVFRGSLYRLDYRANQDYVTSRLFYKIYYQTKFDDHITHEFYSIGNGMYYEKIYEGKERNVIVGERQGIIAREESTSKQ